MQFPVACYGVTFCVNEYFHGDTCEGLGANHQTGWTALVAEMIQWCWCD